MSRLSSGAALVKGHARTPELMADPGPGDLFDLVPQLRDCVKTFSRGLWRWGTRERRLSSAAGSAPRAFGAFSKPWRLALTVGCGAGLLAISAAAEEAAPPLFQRVVVLGASFGAGFDSANPFGGPKTREYRFAPYLEAALIGTHEPVMTQASILLFMKPAETMERKVTATVAARPSLVIGLDALFWFCYGADRTPAQRLEFFDLGLRFLERIEAPLVVGDIPDASRSIGGILSREEMPPLATIAQCNERLKAWAKTRASVTVFPLADLMARAGENAALTVGDLTWEAGQSRALLQGDLLHPTQRSLAALAIATLEAVAGPETSAATVRGNLEAVCAAGLERSHAPPPATPN